MISTLSQLVKINTYKVFYYRTPKKQSFLAAILTTFSVHHKSACSLYSLYLLNNNSDFIVSTAERRKCLGPALWRSWTTAWLDQREQITVISLWTSWACGPSSHCSWKPPKRWRKLELRRRSMKVSQQQQTPCLCDGCNHSVLTWFSNGTCRAKQWKQWCDIRQFSN